MNTLKSIIKPGDTIYLDDMQGVIGHISWYINRKPECFVDIAESKTGSFSARCVPIDMIGVNWFPIITDCCRSNVQEYACQVETGLGFGVDKCLMAEILGLHAQGVKTIGCCCGHGKLVPYIQVRAEHCVTMDELGYTARPVDKHGNGKWCYAPKTALPTHKREEPQ